MKNSTMYLISNIKRTILGMLSALLLLSAESLTDIAVYQLLAAEQTHQTNKPENLELLIKETPKPNYGVPVPEKITGFIRVVTNDDSVGVAGVSVSDGYSTVKTNSQGAYTIIPNEHAVFINIVRPAEYDIQGDWYQPLDEQVDFELKPTTQDENEFLFIHVTDTHVSTNPRSVEGLSQFVTEVNAMTELPRFVFNSGDLLDLSKSLGSSPETGHAGFRNYVGIMNHLKMPHYNVAGDHTDSSYRLKEFPRGDHRCAKPMYWEYLGPHFFSFEYGKIHFVSVDYGYHLGLSQRMVNGQKREYPTYEVQPMHTQWMQQDMALRSPGSFVITSAEHDLTKHCPDFLTMVKDHDVRLQLVGDHHIVTEKKRPIPYRVGGALAGCWWNPKANQLCPDLSPQGYMIYHVVGEKLDYFYKGLGQRIAITTPRLGAAWSDQVEIQAHLVEPKPEETLEYTLNGSDWHPMQEIGRPFSRLLFSAKVDSKTLSDGLIHLKVRSSQSSEVRSRTFVIANNRPSHKYNSEATLSFKIGPKSSFTTTKAPTGKTEVLFNGKVIGVLKPHASKEYSFNVEPDNLTVVNKLSFRFDSPEDGMSLSSPSLLFQGNTYRDPRDAALRQIKKAHWGNDAADWGGFIAGNAAPPDETPFIHRQNNFSFVLNTPE